MEKTKIYCPKIDKTFDSQTEAAKYFLKNYWLDIKEKTARLRINDVVNGHLQNYRGYTFYKV